MHNRFARRMLVIASGFRDGLADTAMSHGTDTVGDPSWPTHGIDPALLKQLREEIAPTQLWSLLLSIIERRAEVRDAAALARQWEQDRFVEPAYIDQRTSLELDRHLFSAAAEFEAIELSPLAPLGACSVVAPTSQNRVVSTVRGTEVISDPTNVLALESARRLRKDPASIVKLATSHRCVRAQALPKLPGYAAHFRMFCLTTAGHETKDQAFTVDALIDHVRTHMRALQLLEQHGYAFPGRAVTLLSTPERRFLADRVAAALGEIEVKHEPLTKEYYNGLRFMINVRGEQGEFPLVDGGAFDWVAKLASNRKLAFVASGMGSQLVAYVFNLSRRER